jgi:shikimate kinase
MGNIILIGASGSGKSTLGKLAAEKTGMRHLDIDTMVMDYAIEGGNPASVFLHFLEYQSRAVQEALRRREPVIISTGAEIITNRSDFALLCDFGYVVHVRRSSDMSAESGSGVVLVRTSIGADGEKAEKIYDGNSFIKDYEQELPAYDEAADEILDNNGAVEEGLEKLIALISKVRA